MKLAVVGTGYVGLVTGACFSEMGNTVVCVDIDEKKIDDLNKGIVPIYEPGLKELIHKNNNKSLYFSTNIKEAILTSDLVFIAVGTPMQSDGNADLSAVFEVAKEIGETISSYKVVISKSTVPVGTTLKVKEIINNGLKRRNLKIDFDVASNPEFLKEGAAINDFMKPDRVVIGAEKEAVFNIMKKLYSPFFRTHDRFITMDISSSEMTKYAANAMLATKISFINEIANICEKVGADVNKVRVGIGSDTRIGYDFIYPGIGYGGTCFPKDIAALIQIGKKNGYEPQLISSVAKVNENQRVFFLNRIIQRLGKDLFGKKIAIWGLSFKPETDDMREAPATYIVKELIKRGAEIRVYDPKAMLEAKKNNLKGLDVFFAKNKYEALEDVAALVLLTEWKEFRSPDFDHMKTIMKEPVIFDGRNQYKDFDLYKNEIEYHQIGKLEAK